MYFLEFLAVFAIARVSRHVGAAGLKKSQSQFAG
jgi:hypothetical protein